MRIPFKSLCGPWNPDGKLVFCNQAMKQAGAEPFPTIYVDGKEEDKKWDVAAKAQMKKVTKIWQADMRKAEKASAKEVRVLIR